MDQLSEAIPVVAGICIRDGEILLSERPPGSHLEGYWEFAGGKLNPGESPRAALDREWREELAVTISEAREWTFIYEEFEEKSVLLLFFFVEFDGEAKPQEGQRISWVSKEEALSMKLGPADARALRRLIQEA